jgi:hypothetical protein
MEDYPIIKSNLTSAIKRRHPSLIDDETKKVAEAIIDLVAKHYGNGEAISFIKVNSDGTWDLTIYGDEIIDNSIKK